MAMTMRPVKGQKKEKKGKEFIYGTLGLHVTK